MRSYSNYWSIDHDARFRIWPQDGPLIRPGSFRYPVEQRWGAAGTLFDNEIGDGELYGPERVYYHQGFDFGGADRMVPIYAATEGVVVSARGESADDIPDCVRPRYDVVYLRDGRGWYYRYRPTLKVTDAKGNVDYDFGKVTAADPDIPSLQRCYLHASYWPTKEIHIGDEVTFLVRSFRFVPPQGDEIWDFGDGSPAAHSRSDGAVDHHKKDGYGTVTHRFKKAGHYVVTVRRSNSDTQWAVDKLDVRVK